MKTLNKIQKCTEINENKQMCVSKSVVYPGLRWGFLWSKSQKTSRLPESRLRGQDPREKLPYLYSDSRLNTPECYLSWQLQTKKCLESIKMNGDV